jgi:hypothetical protein
LRENQLFSAFQLEQQLDLPEEFGLIDTSRQNFLMKLAKGNIELSIIPKAIFVPGFNWIFTSSLFLPTPLILFICFEIEEGERYKFDAFSGRKRISRHQFNCCRILYCSRRTIMIPIVSMIFGTQSLSKSRLFDANIDYLNEGILRHTVNVEIFVEPGTR